MIQDSLAEPTITTTKRICTFRELDMLVNVLLWAVLDSYIGGSQSEESSLEDIGVERKMVSTASEKKAGEIVVEPSDRLFNELGNNTYDYKDLLSELIDNAIAAIIPRKKLQVEITLHVDNERNPVRFTIRDNASGIASEKLAKAITPAGIQSSESLNEHGLGMKQAVAALGDLEYLATKTVDEDKARAIKKFKFGKIPFFHRDFEYDCGTEISIISLKPIVETSSQSYTMSVVPYLGARYRRFLRADNKRLDLFIKIKNTDTNVVDYEWDVKGISPVYFHPNTRTNKPVFETHKLSGSGWKATLTFGYAPQTEAEYNELGFTIRKDGNGLSKMKKYNPYYVSLGKQGFDVIRHDRVILFHQLSELKIVAARHPDYNVIRGEIDLLKGFQTAITKNSIIADRNFRECISQIQDILTGEIAGPSGMKRKYLKMMTYPDQIPERLLRDRLKDWLENNPIMKKKNVITEYSVEGIGGSIDILADGEAWELKIQQANAMDVYQLFMYMDVGDIKKGYLAAKRFTSGAEVARQHIEQNHKKKIELATLDKFPILQPSNDEERAQYY